MAKDTKSTKFQVVCTPRQRTMFLKIWDIVQACEGDTSKLENVTLGDIMELVDQQEKLDNSMNDLLSKRKK